MITPAGSPPIGPAGSFPGATAVSRLRVYDWPAADGLRGGSPHLHTASAEGYVVLHGTGTLETLSGDGYGEHPLAPGTLLWFTPGTVHRLVTTGGDLDILVIMQNAGLPEAGDAVLTFPPAVLADPAAYAAAVALATPDELEAGPQLGGSTSDAAARRRRDLALDGYLDLREQVQARGPGALAGLHRAAGTLVRDRARRWRGLWERRALEQALATGAHLDDLAEGRADFLLGSAVYTADPLGHPPRYGMCGRLSLWDVEHAHRA